MGTVPFKFVEAIVVGRCGAQGFAASRAGQPWYAIPFEDTDIRERAQERWGVTSLPALLLMRVDGTLISADGVALVSADPTGSRAATACSISVTC